MNLEIINLDWGEQPLDIMDALHIDYYTNLHKLHSSLDSLPYKHFNAVTIYKNILDAPKVQQLCKSAQSILICTDGYLYNISLKNFFLQLFEGYINQKVIQELNDCGEDAIVTALELLFLKVYNFKQAVVFPPINLSHLNSAKKYSLIHISASQALSYKIVNFIKLSKKQYQSHKENIFPSDTLLLTNEVNCINSEAQYFNDVYQILSILNALKNHHQYIGIIYGMENNRIILLILIKVNYDRK